MKHQGGGYCPARRRRQRANAAAPASNVATAQVPDSGTAAEDVALIEKLRTKEEGFQLLPSSEDVATVLPPGSDQIAVDMVASFALFHAVSDPLPAPTTIQ